MDMHRAFLAIALSFIIMLGYQYFFIGSPAQQQDGQGQPGTEQAVPGNSPAVSQPVMIAPSVTAQPQLAAVDVNARDILIDTPLYSAVINEQGGGFKSFVLKKYKQKNSATSANLDLVQTELPAELPLLFTLDNGSAAILPLYKANRETLSVVAGEQPRSIALKSALHDGIEITQTLTFDPESYLVDINYEVNNNSEHPVQISPAMTLVNAPFVAEESASRYMFSGPVAYVDGQLTEVKGNKLSDGVQTLQGNVEWSAYEDNYFIFAVMPQQAGSRIVTMSGTEEKVRTVISEGLITLNPGDSKGFGYKSYVGPKKLEILEEAGSNLSRAVNFGWFDVLAKPMLTLLNFFHLYFKNYGVAIILLTVLIKLVFWPITQKGMKSMKNMQKLQPKVAKLKEKFKSDPQKMNQEMMALYKSYKVNPLGGCLPMFLQIPFFFALYKVLLLSIELRHAPFLLWISDLSAPDRLWIGFEIPYLHGIPVLTILMGASMYLQQKMTPTTADPTQARIMQMLPVIFTFMFLNFASGLVLYWFINNLLSILQQQLINRQIKA